MEIEKTSQGKGPRVIQSKNGPEGQVNIVDNRANPFRSLMMGGKVSQRVIQRVNEANGKFIFSPQSDESPEYRVPYQEGRIFFTNYGSLNDEILSAGFNGCYMMVFRFNRDPGRITEVDALFAPGSYFLPPIGRGGVFVAHVASNARDVFYDAVRRRLIFIEVIFRPYEGRTKPHLLKKRYGPKAISDAKAASKKFTGGLERLKLPGQKGWRGSVYTQELIPDDWEVEKKKWFKKKDYSSTILSPHNSKWRNETAVLKLDPFQMKTQTQANMAYLFARIFIDGLIVGDSDRMRFTLRRLRQIRKKNAAAIAIARDEVLIKEEDGNPGASITGSDIAEFLTAILQGEENNYIAFLRRRLERTPLGSLPSRRLPPRLMMSSLHSSSEEEPIKEENPDIEEHSDGEQTSDEEAKTEKKETDLDDDDDDDD